MALALHSKEETIGFEHKGIGAVLAHNRLAVPLNQREYSWEEEHVWDLFRDFANAVANNQATYFLGTIVLTRGSADIPEVSDGQQRLATTTILLAAIRDYFFRNNDEKRAVSIEQEFLKTTDLETTETVPKLRLNVDDNEFFTRCIVSAPDSSDRKIEPTKDSHQRIKKAAEIAAQHIQGILEPYKEPARIARLLEWVKFVRDGAQVILLRVPDHLNAFVMFETLNDRGLKASQADLLKNHLLSFAGDRIKEGQQKWAQMLGVLESLGEEDVTVTYLHHLLIAKNGPTKQREVFDKVKQTINSQARALEFLAELAESASDYAALFNSDHRKWSEYGTSTRKHIATMNRDLRVAQIRPLMFAVAKHFSVKEARLAFKLFVFWSVRFLIAGGRGGLLDRNYALRTQEVGTGKVKTAKLLASAMEDVVPSDAIFEAAFAEARVSLNYLARYYLRAMELKRKGDPQPEFVPSDEEQVINLEHILPENPGAGWAHIDADTAAAYYKRIGNMVILQAKQNSVIGNASFANKKPTLKESNFSLTSEVASYSIWGIKEINERQKKLAQLAVKTWPLTV
ncbi:MAG TPA: DUF262 domain-containing HNH endonuclease family protein [Candidatus Acidoferrales bacterium]|nr:DUF262 domain-containing HNH endonuclease family protein [Candidatus Acidoferrales bacterium]HEV2304542.1 DUF262 domain-containing HNH endonuclease family protein [Candidatus Acidoferrales bacterium]